MINISYLAESESTDESKRFIDKTIDSFIDLITESEGTSRPKRSTYNENGFGGNVVGKYTEKMERILCTNVVGNEEITAWPKNNYKWCYNIVFVLASVSSCSGRGHGFEPDLLTVMG